MADFDAGSDYPRLKLVFYHPELQRVSYNPENLFQIDRILKKRYKNGRTEVLVQWKNYPSKFNSWVAGDTLTPI